MCYFYISPCPVSISDNYLFKHSLRVGYPRGFLPPGSSVGEMLAGGELVHGDHGTAGLLPSQLQHGEQVQGHRAHVGQRADLGREIRKFSGDSGGVRSR